MNTYAANTEVSSDKSRSEIERTLKRYGADAFGYGWEDNRAVVQFRANDRHVRFVLPLPDRAQFVRTPSRNPRPSAAQVEKAYEQAVRQRWRALALAVKAKLESVEAGIATFEEEFLAHIVLPDGSTVAQFMVPQVAVAYENGSMPKMLPGVGETS